MNASHGTFVRELTFPKCNRKSSRIEHIVITQNFTTFAEIAKNRNKRSSTPGKMGIEKKASSFYLQRPNKTKDINSDNPLNRLCAYGKNHSPNINIKGVFYKDNKNCDIRRDDTLTTNPCSYEMQSQIKCLEKKQSDRKEAYIKDICDFSEDSFSKDSITRSNPDIFHYHANQDFLNTESSLGQNEIISYNQNNAQRSLIPRRINNKIIKRGPDKENLMISDSNASIKSNSDGIIKNNQGHNNSDTQKTTIDNCIIKRGPDKENLMIAGSNTSIKSNSDEIIKNNQGHNNNSDTQETTIDNCLDETEHCSDLENDTKTDSHGPYLQNRIDNELEPILDPGELIDELIMCQYCSRKFAKDRISNHEKICMNICNKQRKQYNSTRHRLYGTDQETYNNKAVIGNTKKVAKGNRKSSCSGERKNLKEKPITKQVPKRDPSRGSNKKTDIGKNISETKPTNRQKQNFNMDNHIKQTENSIEHQNQKKSKPNIRCPENRTKVPKNFQPNKEPAAAQIAREESDNSLSETKPTNRQNQHFNMNNYIKQTENSIEHQNQKKSKSNIRSPENRTNLQKNKEPVAAPITNEESDNPLSAKLPETEEAVNLFSCQQCKRKFAADRIQMHEKICMRTFKKQRMQYNSTKHRLFGTDLEGYFVGTMVGDNREERCGTRRKGSRGRQSNSNSSAKLEVSPQKSQKCDLIQEE